MKVKDIVKQLSELDQDEEICIAYWRKELFDYDEDSHLYLTDDGWKKIVSEFEDSQQSFVGDIAWEWFQFAVIDHSNDKIEEYDEQGS